MNFWGGKCQSGLAHFTLAQATPRQCGILRHMALLLLPEAASDYNQAHTPVMRHLVQPGSIIKRRYGKYFIHLYKLIYHSSVIYHLLTLHSQQRHEVSEAWSVWLRRPFFIFLFNKLIQQTCLLLLQISFKFILIAPCIYISNYVLYKWADKNKILKEVKCNKIAKRSY